MLRTVLIGTVLALFLSTGARADSETESLESAVCPDAELLSGKLITDIPWSEIFPIYMAGATWGDGHIPSKAAKNPLCLCYDDWGMPEVGVGIGFWNPARIVELVRQPGCTPSLGGIVLYDGDRLYGSPGKGDASGHADKAFYHYHEYAFPLLFMLDLFFDSSCVTDGFSEMDLLMMSELDPTWVDDELSFFQAPEAVIVADPIAVGACAVDAVAAMAAEPVDELFWCAGNWGVLYPFVGHDTADGSLAENTSLLMARGLAVMHRRGLAWTTIGDDAECGAQIDPMFPKLQYKASTFFPLAEATDAHVIGEYTPLWGDHRKIPGAGEDVVYMVFRWQDCCMR